MPRYLDKQRARNPGYVVSGFGLLCQLCFEGKDLSQSEKDVLKESMSLATVRSQTSEFFLSFMSPRNIHNEACLATIGLAIESMFDAMLSADAAPQPAYREMYASMYVSQMLFVFKDN